MSVNRSYPYPIMITTALIVVGLLSVVAMVVFVLSVACAPEGNEDETGFHYAEEPVAVSARCPRAKRVARRTAKAAHPLKVHIPAA